MFSNASDEPLKIAHTYKYICPKEYDLELHEYTQNSTLRDKTMIDKNKKVIDGVSE